MINTQRTSLSFLLASFQHELNMIERLSLLFIAYNPLTFHSQENIKKVQISLRPLVSCFDCAGTPKKYPSIIRLCHKILSAITQNEHNRTENNPFIV